MDSFTYILASICVGISVSCTFLYVICVLEQIQVDGQVVDKFEKRELPIMFKFFMPFTPNLISIARSNSFDDHRNQLREKILMAGYDNTIDADKFICIEILMTAFGVLVCIALSIPGYPHYGLIVLPCFWYFPQMWIKKTVAKRHLAIQKALPNVLDLLTLSVEAGKDFLTSLRDILARRKTDPLGEELERTFREIQLGKKRVDALKDLVKRVQQPDLSSVMNAIIQADELGVSIAQLLKIQGDQLRMKRFQRAEKMANETPVKIIFPVAIFIFPAVLIILGGPLIMQAMQAIFK